jgi:hypothetical protein
MRFRPNKPDTPRPAMRLRCSGHLEWISEKEFVLEVLEAIEHSASAMATRELLRQGRVTRRSGSRPKEAKAMGREQMDRS